MITSSTVFGKPEDGEKAEEKVTELAAAVERFLRV
jgi:hypothetical protein